MKVNDKIKFLEFAEIFFQGFMRDYVKKIVLKNDIPQFDANVYKSWGIHGKYFIKMLRLSMSACSRVVIISDRELQSIFIAMWSDMIINIHNKNKESYRFLYADKKPKTKIELDDDDI